MPIQALVDIDVDADFGLAKALRIAQGCGLKKLVGDSIKRVIHVVILGDVEDKIRCLSSIKGFFAVDLRLFVKLCRVDPQILRLLGVTPIPTSLSKRVIGYTSIDDSICVIEKTSSGDTIMVRVLKVRRPPVHLLLEPSLYLIQAPNTEIFNEISRALEILMRFEKSAANIINTVCQD